MQPSSIIYARNLMHDVLRRLALSLLLPIILLSLGLVVADAAAQSDQPPRASPSTVSAEASVPGRLVIAVPPGTERSRLDATLARRGAELERWLPELGLALVNIPVGAEAQAARILRDDSLTDFVAEHRKMVQIADLPLDQYFSQQWGMDTVNGPQAWNVAWGDPGTVIAVVDTGVNTLQQDLRAQTWINPGESNVDPDTGQRVCDGNGYDDDGNGYVDDCRGWNFPDRNGNPDDGHGHGTVVTGIAVATTNNYNSVLGVYAGVAGMARGTHYMALRALDNTGQGYAIDVAEAISYAADMGARVINLSLTLPTPNPDPNTVEILRRAVEYAQAKDVLVIGASGNLGYGMIFYPARFPGVLAVGASTQADTRASFSNYGDRLDLVAPGVGIFSTLRGPGFSSYGLFNGSGNGTSFAAPHVAGVAALVRGLRPDLGHAAVRDLITATVTDLAPPGFDPEMGWGRLDAFGAVYSATAGLGLSLFTDPPTIAAGEPVTVTMRVIAPGGAPAGFGGRVALSATTGLIAPALVTVDGTGRATAVFTAPLGATQAKITATLGSVSTAFGVLVSGRAKSYLPMVAQ